MQISAKLSLTVPQTMIAPPPKPVIAGGGVSRAVWSPRIAGRASRPILDGGSVMMPVTPLALRTPSVMMMNTVTRAGTARLGSGVALSTTRSTDLAQHSAPSRARLMLGVKQPDSDTAVSTAHAIWTLRNVAGMVMGLQAARLSAPLQIGRRPHVQHTASALKTNIVIPMDGAMKRSLAVGILTPLMACAPITSAITLLDAQIMPSVQVDNTVTPTGIAGRITTAVIMMTLSMANVPTLNAPHSRHGTPPTTHLQITPDVKPTATVVLPRPATKIMPSAGPQQHTTTHNALLLMNVIALNIAVSLACAGLPMCAACLPTTLMPATPTVSSTPLRILLPLPALLMTIVEKTCTAIQVVHVGMNRAAASMMTQ